MNRDANKVITLTRNAIGFWNLENGALECLVAEKPLGGKISILYSSNRALSAVLLLYLYVI